MLAIPRLIIGEPVNLVVVCVMGFSYCLHYTFMGRLAELFAGFLQPFVISAIALIAIMTWYRIKDAQSRLRAHDVVIFAIAVVLYPFLIVHEEFTRLWMHLLYLAMLIQVCGLLVLARFRASRERSMDPVAV